MVLLPFWTVFAAFAQDPGEEPAPTDDLTEVPLEAEEDLTKVPLELAEDPEATEEDEFAEEITVYGENAIRQARWDLITALNRMGWDPVDKPNGRTAFKPPRRWMGRARLDAEGNLSFTYPVVRFQKISAAEPRPIESNPAFDRDIGGNVVETSGGVVSTLPAGNASLWLLPSRALLDGVYAQVRQAVQPEAQQLARVQRDTAIRATVDAIPAELDALWTRGVPLTGSTPVDGEAARRATILAYWATRADTAEGRQATLVIERWIRNTLEGDAAPTDAELALAESQRADGRKLR